MPRNHSTHSRDLTLLKMASQGIPHPIICEEMGLTPGTLKSALRRIRKQEKEKALGNNSRDGSEISSGPLPSGPNLCYIMENG